MADETPVTREEGWCPVGAPWIVALAVMLATFMEVLDSTVVNVSLTQIAGNLSATLDEATWVVTSYLVSNAIVLPTTGWFSQLFGRKRFLMFCVAAFAVSSFLCGMATSLSSLVVFRILQGLCGGGLQPIAQAILLETFPLRKRGMGMAIFGIGVVFAPIIGPTLGGWITDNYTWRWIFYINLPVSAIALLMIHTYVVDPPYLRRGVARIDYMGLGLLALGIGALQMVLDNGQKHDWFQTGWILQLSLISLASLVALVIWELRTDHPIINLRVFLARNFAPGVTLIFCLGIALYSSMVLLPLFLQTLLGYSATQSGLVMSPGGIGTLICMPIVGFLVGRRDPRLLIIMGLVLLGISMFMMARYSLDIGFWDVVWPRVLMGIGLAFLFVPISTAAFAFTSREQTGQATGIFNLMRNIGGSVGIAMVNTVLAQRQQFHQARLVENASLGNPAFQQWMQQMTQHLIAAGQSSLIAQREALGIAYGMVQKQARTLSFVDCFWLLGVIMIVLIPVVFIMKRPPRDTAPAAGH